MDKVLLNLARDKAFQRLIKLEKGHRHKAQQKPSKQRQEESTTRGKHVNALYDVYISTHASAWIINLIAHRRRNVETNPHIMLKSLQYSTPICG